MIFFKTFLALSYSVCLVHASFNFSDIKELQAEPSSFISIIPSDNSGVDLQTTIGIKRTSSQISRPDSATADISNISISQASERSYSSNPSKTTRISSGSIPLVEERPSYSSQDNYLGMSVDQVIELELTLSKLNSKSKQQLKTTLQIIAENNYSAFIQNESKFISDFKVPYGNYKKHHLDADVFLLRYLFMFGAFDLFKALKIYNVPIPNHIMPFVKYLLDTKPLETVLRVFTARSFTVSVDLMENIKSEMYAKYPDMRQFHRDILDSVGKTDLSLFKDLSLQTVEDFELVTQKLIQNFDNGLFAFAVEFVNDYTALYAASSNATFKSFYIFAAIKTDNVDELIKLLILDPEMLFFLFSLKGNRNDVSLPVSAVVIAMEFNSIRCLHFFLKEFPELTTASAIKSQPNLFMTPVAAVSVIHRFHIYCPVLKEFGFGAETVIDFKDLGRFNLLQGALLAGNLNALKYYVGIVGKQRAKEMIHSAKRNLKSIPDSIRPKFSSSFTNYVFELMGIDERRLEHLRLSKRMHKS